MESSLIDPAAKIGRNVTFGHGVRVYGNVEIGDDCRIGDFSVIGHPSAQPDTAQPLRLGAGSSVRVSARMLPAASMTQLRQPEVPISMPRKSCTKYGYKTEE